MKLDGTVALVTGGARRVGRAIALELADAGCDVAVHYRHSRAHALELADTIKGLGRRAVAVSADLRDPAGWPIIINATAEDLGRLDILVNNASEFLTDTPDKIDTFAPDLWDRILRTNLTAVAGLAHHAMHHLAAHGMGKIVNLSDISAQRPWPDHLAYCVSKAGLDALTKGLARALAPTIQVNGIALGTAAFPESYSNDLRRAIVERIPLGRAGTPEEVARVARFLVETADYMTGEIVRFDGGRATV